MLIYPILAVACATASNLIEKIFFQRNRRLGDRGVIAYLFLFTFIFLSIGFFPYYGQVSDGAFTLWPISMLIAMGALGLAGNILYYYGFPKEHLSEIQPFTVITPLLTIVAAGLVYPDERSLFHFSLALVAGAVLFITHTKDRSLRFNPGLISIAVSVLFFASEVLLAKQLLMYFSPVALYTYRVGIIAVLLMIIFRPSIRLVFQQNWIPMISVPLTWIGSVVFVYTSITFVGIVQTTMVLMLTPVLTVLGSVVLLREKETKWSDIIALITILSLVIIAQMYPQ